MSARDVIRCGCDDPDMARVVMARYDAHAFLVAQAVAILARTDDLRALTDDELLALHLELGVRTEA